MFANLLSKKSYSNSLSKSSSNQKAKSLLHCGIMVIIAQCNNDFASWFHDFFVKFAKKLNNNDITVCSCRPKDISNSWWCQTRPWKIFSKLACGSFRKDLSRTRLASSLVENIFRTPRTHSNATLPYGLRFDEKNLGYYHTEIYLINFRISYSNEVSSILFVLRVNKLAHFAVFKKKACSFIDFIKILDHSVFSCPKQRHIFH